MVLKAGDESGLALFEAVAKRVDGTKMSEVSADEVEPLV